MDSNRKARAKEWERKEDNNRNPLPNVRANLMRGIRLYHPLCRTLVLITLLRLQVLVRVCVICFFLCAFFISSPEQKKNELPMVYYLLFPEAAVHVCPHLPSTFAYPIGSIV